MRFRARQSILRILLLGILQTDLLIVRVASAMSRVAIVTGANKGIGFAIARKLGEAPNHVCILTSRDPNRGQKAVEQLEAEGVKTLFKQLDINDPGSVERFATEMEAEYGCCDILVNNGAIAFKGSDPTPFRDQAQPTLQTNFFDTVAFTERMLPLLRKSSAGRVINVASSSGHLSILKTNALRAAFTDPSLTKERLSSLMKTFIEDVLAGRHAAEGWPSTCYGMSKLGLIAYTKVAARIEREGGSGVLVNACCPGYCDTDMTSHRGYLTPEEGARTPFMLSQMDDNGITGGFFKSQAPVDW